MTRPTIRDSVFWSGDTQVRRLARAEKPSDQAVIIFHGFPGQPPPGEEGKYLRKPKLRVELAQTVAASLGWDAYLPGYEGLGESRGKFSFESSVVRSIELSRAAAERGHRHLHVIGHSWGAFVAPYVWDALRNAGKLVLLSGLLDLPNEAAVRSFLPYYIEHYPNILGADPDALNRAAADLDSARRRFNPMSRPAVVRALSNDLLTIYSTRDTYVDPAASRRFHERFGGSLIELDDDHIFSSDMPRVISEVVRFLSNA